MGLHSLKPVKPAWEIDPDDVYGNQVLRIRAYVEEHYEFERPSYGYDKARIMAHTLAVALDLGQKSQTTDTLRYRYSIAARDARRVFDLVERYDRRMDVVQALAHLQRNLNTIKNNEGK